MPLILHLETTEKICSVAISDGDSLIALTESQKAFDHASALTGLITETVEKAAIQLSDLEAVSLSAGPGSYTGIRIGASAAKGLCFAIDVPLISVPTFETMLFGIKNQIIESFDFFIPMVEARRNDVFTCVFDATGKTVFSQNVVTLHRDSLNEMGAIGKTLLFGSGALKAQSILSHSNAIFFHDFEKSAKWQVHTAFDLFLRKFYSDIAYYEPDYIKPVFINQL